MASNNSQQLQSSSQPSFSPLVWFQLVDSTTGLSYKGTSADYVSLSPDSVIAQFREAVKKKDKEDGDAAILTPFKSSQLLVYKNKAAFDKRNPAVDEEKEEPLDPTESLGLLGSKKDMLVVAVPSQNESGSYSKRPLASDEEISNQLSKRQRYITNESSQGNQGKMISPLNIIWIQIFL